MAEIESVQGRPIIHYAARDYDSLLQAMREQIPYTLPEWTDAESEADFGNALLQLFAHMGDILSYYQDRIANESFLGTAQTRRSIIQHLQLIGYRLGTAVPASTTLRLTVPIDRTKIITITKGNAFATKSQGERPSLRFEYTREAPLTIDCGSTNFIPDPDPTQRVKHLEKAIPVEEGRFVVDERLGTSNGNPNQIYRLARPGMILKAFGQGQQIRKDIILLTELGGVIDSWTLQESLAFSRVSRAEQKDFSIDIDADDRATIRFGDGDFGAIPPSGSTIRVTYRVGGGLQGNVPANSIETIVDAPQLTQLGATVTNLEPATGGSDRESIDQAVKQAPKVFRALNRAVTAGDYKALALNFTGVGKVRATAAGWNTVKLFVAPTGGGYVSDVLKANLLAYFEDKRPVSTIIEVEDVDYVKVYITATIGVKSYYDPMVVQQAVEKAVGQLLAFDNVDFGITLYLSKVYEEIENIDGIEYVTISEFRRDPPHPDYPAHKSLSEGKIVLDDNEIPRIPNDPTDDSAYGKGIKVLLPEVK